MLINCPRCGFSQPKDHYCAKCGVDMDTYKPSAPSLKQKVLMNPYLQGAAIVIAVMGTVFFIRQEQKKELSSRVEYLSGQPIVMKKAIPSSGNVEIVAAADESTTEEVTDTSSTLPASAPPEPLTGPTSGATTRSAVAITRPDTEATAASIAPKNSIKVLMTLAESDRASTQSLMQEMQSTGQFNRFDRASWGVVNNLSSRIKSLRGISSMEKLEKFLDLQNPVSQWFSGYRISGEGAEGEIGFTFFLSMVPGEDSSKVELEVQSSFRDATSHQMLKRSYPVSFELSPGQGFVMTGILPRTADVDDELGSQGFLKILNSAQFQSQQSEFTLFLEFDTPTSPKTK